MVIKLSLLLLLLFPFTFIQAQISYFEIPFAQPNQILPQDDGGHFIYSQSRFFRFNQQGEKWVEKQMPSEFESISSLQLTKDGGVICVINTNHIVRLNKMFEEIWRVKYQWVMDSIPLMENAVGNFVMLGRAKADSSIYSYYLSSTGNILDSTYISKDSVEYFQKKNNGKGFLVSSGNYIFDLSDNGDVLWSRGFTQTKTIKFYQLSQSYIVATDSSFIKIDHAGKDLWNKSAKGVLHSSVLYPDFDDGYLSPPASIGPNQITKYNAQGTAVWNHVFSNPLINQRILPTRTGYIFLSEANSTNITRLDLLGNEIWTDNFYEIIGNNKLTYQAIVTKDLGVAVVLFVPDSKKFYAVKISAEGINYSRKVAGKIYQDLNQNCLFDSTDIPLKEWKIYTEPQGRFVLSDSMGNYEVKVDTGFQQFSAIPKNNDWESCTGENHFQLYIHDTIKEVGNMNFGMKGKNCPLLKVSVSAPKLRRCFVTSHKILYSNEGSETAKDVKVGIDLPTSIIPLSLSIPYEKINNQLVFSIGTLLPGASGSITIKDSIDCKTPLGASACVEAWITPDLNCDMVSSEWDRSLIYVTSQCNNDSIIFRIGNQGEAMKDSSMFRLYADDQLIRRGRFLLGDADSITLRIFGDGRSFRLEADQTKNYPGESKPRAFSEQCGNSPSPSLGFIATAHQDDDEENREIMCGKVVGSFDPNDKISWPGNNKLIHAGQWVVYCIRFQNTGTDTAFTVRVIDTLSEHLDLSTFDPDIPTHHCETRFYGYHNNIVEWTFNNIQLPDSSQSKLGSNGYVKFKIKVKQGLPSGTEIKNKAAIYFDYNEAIMTNSVNYQVFIEELQLLSAEKEMDPATLSVAPNPFTTSTHFSVHTNAPLLEFRLFDGLGNEVKKLQNVSHEFEIEKGSLKAGIYFYQVGDGADWMTTGKLMVE